VTIIYFLVVPMTIIYFLVVPVTNIFLVVPVTITYFFMVLVTKIYLQKPKANSTFCIFRSDRRFCNSDLLLAPLTGLFGAAAYICVTRYRIYVTVGVSAL
jgi:hypothetical protein